MEERITLSAAEWRLMQIIWNEHPVTFRRICDLACPEHGWTKHAVISFLKRMEAKGAIRAEDAHPVKLYHPLLDRDEAISAETEDVLARVYANDLLLMVQSAARARNLTDAEISELERILKGGGRK